MGYTSFTDMTLLHPPQEGPPPPQPNLQEEARGYGGEIMRILADPNRPVPNLKAATRLSFITSDSSWCTVDLSGLAVRRCKALPVTFRVSAVGAVEAVPAGLEALIAEHGGALPEVTPLLGARRTRCL